MDFLLPSGNKKILGSETKKRVYQANLSRKGREWSARHSCCSKGLNQCGEFRSIYVGLRVRSDLQQQQLLFWIVELSFDFDLECRK